MSIDHLFDEPGRRRWWLLLKALESVPLHEALKLAQTADEFIAPRDEFIAPRRSGKRLATELTSEEASIADSSLDADILPSPEIAGGGAADSLAVMASSDDVVRFLRRHDDVVVRDGEDAFLVNGRAREGLTELTARANKIRTRERLPPFVVVPQATPIG